jgi:hypothetical protein
MINKHKKVWKFIKNHFPWNTQTKFIHITLLFFVYALYFAKYVCITVKYVCVNISKFTESNRQDHVLEVVSSIDKLDQ